MVVMVWPDVRSGVLPTGAEDEVDVSGDRLISRPISSAISPFSAMGAGSRPRRMKRSASIMKHLSVGSEMYDSGFCSNTERDSTQPSRAASLGSTRGTRRVTMFMQEWTVSLCRVVAWWMMRFMAAGRPPASYTLSDSLAQASSNTWQEGGGEGGGEGRGDGRGKGGEEEGEGKGGGKGVRRWRKMERGEGGGKTRTEEEGKRNKDASVHTCIHVYTMYSVYIHVHA